MRTYKSILKELVASQARRIELLEELARIDQRLIDKQDDLIQALERRTVKEITQEQFEKMVQGSMARGPSYAGDAYRADAVQRTLQMLSRAGIKVKEQ